MGTGGEANDPGVLRLPSGRRVRGRACGPDVPSGWSPKFGLYLQARQPPPFAWQQRFVRRR